MSHSKLRKELNQVLVPKERVIAKGQGCWNCRSWDQKAANPLWTHKRQNDLARVAELLIQLPHEPETVEEAEKMGPIGVRFFQHKSMINSLDHLVASGHIGVCKGGGRTADGNPVGDFVVHSFECDRWSGVTGASLAKIDGKMDILPEELADKLNKPN